MNSPASPRARLSTLDRFLAVWILIAMAVGLGLGRAVPALDDALAALDPREPFALEFLFRDGSVARARFEAGDFAAGQAFLAMGAV